MLVQKNHFFNIVFFILLIIICIMLINFNNKKEMRVCFQNHCFDVELAIKTEEKKKGLMFKEHLDMDKGMLFVYEDEKERSFWMKNVLIPLDIIWINEKNEVVFISENTQLCDGSFCQNINPGKDAKYVLEINAGLSKKIGLIIGDKIDFIEK